MVRGLSLGGNSITYALVAGDVHAFREAVSVRAQGSGRRVQGSGFRV